MESCHKSDKGYGQTYNAFLHELKIFHRNRGSPFHNIPKINGREINLLKFYIAVTDAGGFKIITEQRKWNDVAKVLKFPRGCVNISLSLRKIYARYLKHYEKIHFMKMLKNENIKAESQIKKIKLNQDVPMVYNIAQHDVSDASRSTFGLNKIFVAPNNYIKLCMSLLCGLPNEQELALNMCILLSSKEHFNFDLSQSPKLVDFLIAQAGVWNSDDNALKMLYLESWKNVKGRNMAMFWKSVLDVRNDQLAQFFGSSFDERDLDETLLNIRQGIWCPSPEGELVSKVAVIIYNLSFEKRNKSVLVNNRNLLRFLLFCIHSSWGTLKQMAYDTLGNIAVELKISTEHDIYSRIIMQTVIDGISSCDRFIVIKSMDILSHLCYCIANEDVITSLLNVEVYHQLLLYLTVHDVVLLTHSLDALYALSDLGKYPCDKIASGHHFIATLVSLLTCEANKFEQSAYINMKIIKTSFPVELNVNKEVTSSTTEALKTVSNTTNGLENIACKWLKEKYEINQNCSCSQDEVFSQYVLFCNKSGFMHTSLSLFTTCVKSTFPDSKLKISKSKSGVKTYRYYGFKRKPIISAVSKASKKLNVSHSLSSPNTFLVNNSTNNMKDLDVQNYHLFNSVSDIQKISTDEQSKNTRQEKKQIGLSSITSCNTNTQEYNTCSQNSTPDKKMLQKSASCSNFPPNKQTLVPSTTNKRKILSGNSSATDRQGVEVGKTTKCVDTRISTPATFSALKQKLVSKIFDGFSDSFKTNTIPDQCVVSTANDLPLEKDHYSSNMVPKATFSSNAFISNIPFESIDSLSDMKSHFRSSCNSQDSKLKAESGKLILIPQSSEKQFSSSTQSSDEISFDKHDLSTSSIQSSDEISFDKQDLSTSSRSNTLNKQLLSSNISSPSFLLDSSSNQNNKDYSVKLGLQSDAIISKSPLLCSILNKGTDLIAKNKSYAGIESLFSKDSNFKVIPNAQESTCLKIFPVSSVNTTLKITSHNPENISLPQNLFFTKLAAKNSVTQNALSFLDVPTTPICMENSNNATLIQVISSKPYEIISGENCTVKLQAGNSEDTIQKTTLASVQSPHQVLNSASEIKQIEGQSTAITHFPSCFSKEKESMHIQGFAAVIPPKNVSHVISGDSSVSNSSFKSHLSEEFDVVKEKCSKESLENSPLHQLKTQPSPVEKCKEHNASLFMSLNASSSSKEMKQLLNSETACEKMKYSCNWKDCGLKFSKISSLYLHLSQAHVPVNNDDVICLWDGCGPLKRKRMSLLTHLQDWHCNETSLNSQNTKKQQLPVGRKTAAPFHSGYCPDAAMIAIKRRALQDIDPNKQSAEKKPGNEKEQALEESIRLTSALILRNLVSYSPMARTYIRRFESELVHLAMSQTESSNILAQCLSYLT